MPPSQSILVDYYFPKISHRKYYPAVSKITRSMLWLLSSQDITWKMLSCAVYTQSMTLFVDFCSPMISHEKYYAHYQHVGLNGNCFVRGYHLLQEKKPNFIASVIQWRSSRITDPFGNIVSKLIYDISRLNIWTFPNNECNVYSKTYSWIIISRFCWQFVLSKCFF
jgi:hypothetical protein